MSRGSRSGHELAVTFKAETDNAVLIYDHATDTEHWIPLSQVEQMHRPAGDFPKDGTIIISDWIARKTGLLGE